MVLTANYRFITAPGEHIREAAKKKKKKKAEGRRQKEEEKVAFNRQMWCWRDKMTDKRVEQKMEAASNWTLNKARRPDDSRYLKKPTISA